MICLKKGATLPDAKKRAAVAGGSSDNREASNRVDRSHSVSKIGRLCNDRESLTNRKQMRHFPKNLTVGDRARDFFPPELFFEELVGGRSRGLLFRHCGLKPGDLLVEQRDGFAQFLDRQQ